MEGAGILHSNSINIQATPPSTHAPSISFYKENGLWYADLPEFLEQGLGERANLLMVDGSDTFLDRLSSGASRLTIHVSTRQDNRYPIQLKKVARGLDRDLLDSVGHAPVDYGAYYDVVRYNNEAFQHLLWLCPVAEYFFQGDYPDNIYFKLA